MLMFHIEIDILAFDQDGVFAKIRVAADLIAVAQGGFINKGYVQVGVVACFLKARPETTGVCGHSDPADKDGVCIIRRELARNRLEVLPVLIHTVYYTLSGLAILWRHERGHVMLDEATRVGARQGTAAGDRSIASRRT